MLSFSGWARNSGSQCTSAVAYLRGRIASIGDLPTDLDQQRSTLFSNSVGRIVVRPAEVLVRAVKLDTLLFLWRALQVFLRNLKSGPYRRIVRSHDRHPGTLFGEHGSVPRASIE